MEPRPTAEHFLELIRQHRRGRFKLYLGMSAGVGKTYRMLSDAADLQSRGIGVLVGVVETHGRKETHAKLQGLHLHPQRTIFYKGKAFEEMDLEGLLRLRPEIVVVDELAHTNAPGSENEKRYQDVEALLEAGINVISALNIQHIESLNPVVEKITGIEVSERVPDRIVQLADEVVTIDLTAEELIERLKDGKIYKPDKVDTALGNFFTPDNLSQLRELALREVAARLERKLDKTLEKDRRVNPIRLCAAISTNEQSGRHIIRKVARIAAEQSAQWFVVFVETPALSVARINLADQRYLIRNFQLATELGGQVITLKGKDVPETVVEFALQNGVNILVLGKAKPRWLDILLRRDVLSRFLQLLEDKEVDLFILN